MSQKLMHDVGFGSVFRVAHVSQVLCAAEDFECQCIEELPLIVYAVDGFDDKTSPLFEIV